MEGDFNYRNGIHGISSIPFPSIGILLYGVGAGNFIRFAYVRSMIFLYLVLGVVFWAHILNIFSDMIFYNIYMCLLIVICIYANTCSMRLDILNIVKRKNNLNENVCMFKKWERENSERLVMLLKYKWYLSHGILKLLQFFMWFFFASWSLYFIVIPLFVHRIMWPFLPFGVSFLLSVILVLQGCYLYHCYAIDRRRLALASVLNLMMTRDIATECSFDCVVDIIDSYSEHDKYYVFGDLCLWLSHMHPFEVSDNG